MRADRGREGEEGVGRDALNCDGVGEGFEDFMTLLP